MINDSCLSYFLNQQDLRASQDLFTAFFSTTLKKKNHGVDISTIFEETIIDQLKRLFLLGFNGQHYDIILGHLVLTLDSFGIHRELVIEVARAVRPLRTICELGAKRARSIQGKSRLSLTL